MSTASYIRWFRDVRLADVPLVGGKNPSLGELYGELSRAGVCVPDGFAVERSGLVATLATLLAGIGDDVAALAAAGTEAAFLERVRREAEWTTLAVFAALKAQLSPGEAEDILSHLPRDLKEVWTGAQVAA